MFVNIVTISIYDDTFLLISFAIVHIIITWYCHPVTADTVQSSLIEAADGYKSCFCSLLAHTCPWQCHCWWPRHSWRQQRQRHRSSAAALPKSRQCALKSPAYSHGLQQLQILLPDLPTCVTWEPGIPSAHTMFHSSCIQQHLGIWNSLVAKYFPLLH